LGVLRAGRRRTGYTTGAYAAVRRDGAGGGRRGCAHSFARAQQRRDGDRLDERLVGDGIRNN
jgi:hypothetical protein